jgi:ubiquinone/menaquinone biosynthesis C-methylase UbiE
MKQQNNRTWPGEPADAQAFTARFDEFYTRFSRLYDRLVKLLPIWRNWLEAALPAIKGPRVLEIGFGTGYLMTQYAADYEVYGADINTALIKLARENLRSAGLGASLQRASVEKLPFPSGTFDTVLSTMAFTGFPNGKLAMAEMTRVVKPGGKVVIVDVAYPQNGNLAGMAIARVFAASGDILRDIGVLLARSGYECEITPVGGSGSIQLFVGRLGEGETCASGPR